ncbi:MAG: hypothetical protein LBK74_04600 [Treponema sp.]|jgi:hypothetical protein|nr:hypothetical protein [Treponema sp.]
MNRVKTGGMVLELVLFSWVLGAQSVPGNFPSLRPDPSAAEYARRGAGSWEDLAETALWASAVGAAAVGTAARNSPDYRDTLRRAVEELDAEIREEPDLKVRGDYILSYMHRKFLRSYSALQTRLDTLLANGRYNCVSSAVLYLILAQSQGLTVKGVAARDHAFAAVLGDGESWDVETTNPYGFDPGNRREFHDQFGKLTGFAYVPARNYRDRTDISPLELVSLILHNRVAEAESRNRYAEAVPLALNRAVLLAERKDPAVSRFFTDPRQDLNERILNYGAFLLNGGKEEEGLAWAVYAEPLYTGAETDTRWQEYIDILISNRIAKLCRARQFDQARRFLADAESLHSAAERRRLEVLIIDTELTVQVNGIRRDDDTAAVLQRIGEAEAADILPPARVREMRVQVDRWRLANFHNRFAAAFNKRDYPSARQILEEALGEFPENPQLRNDRNTLNRAVEGN